MITLLFARHGQASFGKQNYDELSPLGMKQAQMLGQHYANMQRQIDGIITGNMVRQRDSAVHFLQAYQDSITLKNPNRVKTLPIIEGLNEFNHEDVFIKSNPKFTTHEAILAEIAKAPNPKIRLAELFQEAFDRWHSGEFDEDYLESWSAFNKRVQEALEQIIAMAQKNSDTTAAVTFLIFTSGGVIAALAAKLLNQGSQTAQQINKNLINTGVTAITIKDNNNKDAIKEDDSNENNSKQKNRQLLTLNEHSHLYQAGESYSTWY